MNTTDKKDENEKQLTSANSLQYKSMSMHVLVHYLLVIER